MELLQRSGSRLLFLTAELFEEGRISEYHKHLVKHKIFINDPNLFQAVQVIQDEDLLKQQIVDYAIRLHDQLQLEQMAKVSETDVSSK